MDQENDELLGALYEEMENLKTNNQELHKHISFSQYGQGKDANLITTQLDTQELLEKLERFYRGDYLDSDGNNVVWKKQTNGELIPLNDYGVSVFMEIVTKYIDKNTALSNYKEERIFEILADIGDELTLVVYCNYEKMGLDTPFKKTKFRILVTTTLHIIESTYRRSIEGRTSQDINQSRIVSQSDLLNRLPVSEHSKKRFSWMNPKTWGA